MMLQENFLKQRNFWYKITLIILALAFLYFSMDIWVLLILSIALAFILNPLVEVTTGFKFGKKKWQIPRTLAILFAFLVVAGLIVLSLTVIVGPFLKEVNHLTDSMPFIVKNLQKFVEDLHYYLPQEINGYINQFINNMESYTLQGFKKIARLSLAFISNVIQIIIVPVFTFYFLKDYRTIKKSIVKILPIAYQIEMEAYLNDVAIMLSAYVRGMFKLSVIAATFLSLGTYIMGIPYPLVLGLVAGICETLPIIGPITSFIPAILLAIIYVQNMLVAVVLYYAVYYMVDSNITVPKVMGDEINLHPMAILFSLLIASKIFGILGMIFAVPTTAVLKLSLEYIFMKDR